VRQAGSAVDYIKQHAKDDKPFFMDVNFMKMHNPTNPAPPFRGKSKLGNYSDSMLELDANVGRVMDAIRAEAPNTIVIITADNGAWQDAWPDAGVTPFRGEKGSVFEGAFRTPGIMWAPGKIPAGKVSDELGCLTDFIATAAEITGARLPKDAGEDSFNLLPALQGKKGKPIREAIVHHSSQGLFAIRQGEWKLELGLGSGGFSTHGFSTSGSGSIRFRSSCSE
jgi:arylsulfatase A-like enzyme